MTITIDKGVKMISYRVTVNDNGDRYWYYNLKLHRQDGPAVECLDGTRRWYLNGQEYSEEEYTLALSGRRKRGRRKQ
jgi:hypothetical protein